MDDVGARQLAERITRTWRGSIGTEIWHDVLLEMHHGPAETAWRILRDTVEHQPSIAAFRSAYNAQLGTRREHVACTRCGGDGWQHAAPQLINGLMYDGLKPCTCRNGEAVRDVHRRIVELNDAELRPHRSHSDDHHVGPPTYKHTEVL